MLKDYFEVPNKPAIKSGNVLSCDFTDHETFIPQPLDFTRGTLATYVDCNGFIKVGGIIDTELVTNGNFATNTNWFCILLNFLHYPQNYVMYLLHSQALIYLNLNLK